MRTITLLYLLCLAVLSACASQPPKKQPALIGCNPSGQDYNAKDEVAPRDILYCLYDDGSVGWKIGPQKKLPEGWKK